MITTDTEAPLPGGGIAPEATCMPKSWYVADWANMERYNADRNVEPKALTPEERALFDPIVDAEVSRSH